MTSSVTTEQLAPPAFFGIKSAETLRFYTEVLGMDLSASRDLRDSASK